MSKHTCAYESIETDDVSMQYKVRCYRYYGQQCNCGTDTTCESCRLPAPVIAVCCALLIPPSIPYFHDHISLCKSLLADKCTVPFSSVSFRSPSCESISSFHLFLVLPGNVRCHPELFTTRRPGSNDRLLQITSPPTLTTTSEPSAQSEIRGMLFLSPLIHALRKALPCPWSVPLTEVSAPPSGPLSILHLQPCQCWGW